MGQCIVNVLLQSDGNDYTSPLSIQKIKNKYYLCKNVISKDFSSKLTIERIEKRVEFFSPSVSIVDFKQVNFSIFVCWLKPCHILFE